MRFGICLRKKQSAVLFEPAGFEPAPGCSRPHQRRVCQFHQGPAQLLSALLFVLPGVEPGLNSIRPIPGLFNQDY